MCNSCNNVVPKLYRSSSSQKTDLRASFEMTVDGMGKIWEPPLCESEAFSPSFLTGVLGSGVTVSLVTRSGVPGSRLMDGEDAREEAASTGLAVGPGLLYDDAGEEADMR